MLREHDNHVPSVDGSDEPSHSLISFLDRVDAHDRSLFTEGLDITLANHPIEKPDGIAGQLYDAREDAAVSPVIDALWTLQGAAPLFYDLTVAKLGVDMMTLGATKLYCQKGVGMLYKKRGIIVSSLTHGGGQEFGLRPGTEPVALIHEFAHALAYAQSHREEATEKITALQTYFENQIPKVLPSVQITARTTEDNPMGLRSPHITHIVVPNIESELLVIELDARGIAVSSKSACKNEQDQDSGILTLLYPNENLGAIRVSYGRTTTKRELDKTIRAIQSVLKKYQK
jgi:cysteine desulfurase